VTGIKCPDALYKDRAIRRLIEWQSTPNPDSDSDLAVRNTTTASTNLIIGLRHPVWQIQSYYNYRVTELYDKKVWFKNIHPLPDIILEDRNPNAKPWKGMSPYSYRYELFLQQLDKVGPLTAQELHELLKYPELSVQPNSFRIFVYELAQLQDANADRNAVFRRDLADFLGLQQSLPVVGHENQNRFTGAAAHPETINICDATFDDVRHQMVRDATVSATWIGERFIGGTGTGTGSSSSSSPGAAGVVDSDVTVSNRDHFLEALQGWKRDPCK
jgi:hypothetical protein